MNLFQSRYSRYAPATIQKALQANRKGLCCLAAGLPRVNSIQLEGSVLLGVTADFPDLGCFVGLGSCSVARWKKYAERPTHEPTPV